MLKKLFSIFCLAFILSHSSMAQEPKWLAEIKNIVPLRSTQTDVKSVFGEAVRSYSNIEKYKTKKGTLTVTYSTGECVSGLSDYNVPKGIVLDVDFALSKYVNFTFTDEELSGFKKEVSDDTPNEIYRNTATGITYHVYVKDEEDAEDGKSAKFLTDVSIYPPSKRDDLRCPKITTR